MFHYLTGHRYLDTEKHVAFAVLSFSRLEEIGEGSHLGRVLMREDFVVEIVFHGFVY